MATDGELTVVRRLAGYAYGQWSVDWPESVPEEQRPKLADDREHGYVHRLGSGSGRMGRRFVRADVSVTAAEYDKNGRVPHTGYSNVEDVLDAAVAQTDEDALVERAITRDGLGVLRPGVDFRVGDVVEVMIWGCAVPLPVTAIEAVTEAGAVVDWRVTVGGQVVSDDVERKRANADLERAVWGERRERLKVAREAGEAKAAAAAAQSSADAADAKAVAADGKAKKLAEALSGGGATIPTVMADLQRLNRQLQQNGEGGAADQGLIPAYIAANTKRWELQAELDRQQDALAEANRKATDANTAALKAQEDLALAEKRENRLRPKITFAHQSQWLRAPYDTPDGLFRIEGDSASLDRGATIVARGTWEGDAVMIMSNMNGFGNDGGTEIRFAQIRDDGDRRFFYKPVALVGIRQIVILTVPRLV
ncbi:hypothetical protein ACN4DI_01765 [Corynebacterium macclintockiae]|uniref:hypothetical protein n=1 Tax=Corynebacterium macclintockiae TaxID=2913501 RepID=UPI003EBEA5AD